MEILFPPHIRVWYGGYCRMTWVTLMTSSYQEPTTVQGHQQDYSPPNIRHKLLRIIFPNHTGHLALPMTSSSLWSGIKNSQSKQSTWIHLQKLALCISKQGLPTSTVSVPTWNQSLCTVNHAVLIHTSFPMIRMRWRTEGPRTLKMITPSVVLISFNNQLWYQQLRRSYKLQRETTAKLPRLSSMISQWITLSLRTRKSIPYLQGMNSCTGITIWGMFRSSNSSLWVSRESFHQDLPTLLHLSVRLVLMVN